MVIINLDSNRKFWHDMFTPIWLLMDIMFIVAPRLIEMLRGSSRVLISCCVDGCLVLPHFLLILRSYFIPNVSECLNSKCIHEVICWIFLLLIFLFRFCVATRKRCSTWHTPGHATQFSVRVCKTENPKLKMTIFLFIIMIEFLALWVGVHIY